MTDEELDQLLLMWLDTYDEMMDATVNERRRLEDVERRIAEIEQPYRVTMEALADRIEPYIMVKGSSYADLPRVVAQYRNGYWRVNYNKDIVDVVLALLKDVSPNLADQLQTARKQTSVPPKVTIKVKEG
jgi:hypothetical protein